MASALSFMNFPNFSNVFCFTLDASTPVAGHLRTLSIGFSKSSMLRGTATYEITIVKKYWGPYDFHIIV